ncbi:DmsC/YnfH family molybdoenzyme membrane anchor subunit [Vibrio ulleungensis]|uniref:Dimethyl sulfoxide reductase anchor subunit n=1 Tax=Vibrio ulleungensis TaxID=2807619 RepID=A0ABS2HHS9_9VIBR|nr:DmsC/YnfH family molybdoenzyme membrane anchor subunit [Vibrio ulleungensis]MBM7035654.1 dimethyl sulfoxide reductase anchor subunit [Vibrio ulleungensis]
MIFHEYSLIFFTVLGQTAVGAYILFALRSLVSNESSASRYKVPLFILWAIMGVGFLFSTTHLGSPLRAFNALNKVGSAWLSNEIFFGAAFFAVGGLQWLLNVLGKVSAIINKVMSIITIILGVLFMNAMVTVYLIDTVPTWNNLYTPLSFIMTIVLGGLILWQLMACIAKDSTYNAERNASIVGLLMVAVSLAVTVGKVMLLGDIQTSLAQAQDLVPNLNQYVIAQVVLLVAALIIWILPLINKSRLNPINMGVALVLFWASELLGRALFYSTHMTYGLL